MSRSAYTTPVQGEETVKRKLPWVNIGKKVWYFNTPEDAEAFVVAAGKVRCVSVFRPGVKVPSPRNGG